MIRLDTLPGRADYPRNQWYIGALSSEVTRNPMHRILFDSPVVFYRTEAGEAVALFDRCPHRGMRLSNGGTLVGDAIQCNYHGIQFGADGRSCLIPSGGTPTAAMSVHRYPIQEIAGWLWVWSGNPDLADPSLIPDHTEVGNTAEGFYDYYGLVLEAKSNYLYSFENLVDATHITYLHHGLIDTGNVASHPYRCEQNDSRVSMFRQFENEPISPMMRRAMGIKGERVNRVLELTSYAPNLCIVRQVFTEVDYPDDTPRDTRLVFGITPAGPKSCYQFVSVAQNYENHHPGIFDDLKHLLMEDIVALDDIQLLFDRLESQGLTPEVSVRADEGAIRSRRVIQRQLEAERRLEAAE